MKVAANSRITQAKPKLKEKNAFNSQDSLDSTSLVTRSVEYRTSQRIYSQGDPTTAVLYIQRGSVKLSVVLLDSIWTM